MKSIPIPLLAMHLFARPADPTNYFNFIVPKIKTVRQGGTYKKHIIAYMRLIFI
jgi:hypothetical protein